jgi:hypothetical protein
MTDKETHLYMGSLSNREVIWNPAFIAAAKDNTWFRNRYELGRTMFVSLAWMGQLPMLYVSDPTGRDPTLLVKEAEIRDWVIRSGQLPFIGAERRAKHSKAQSFDIFDLDVEAEALLKRSQEWRDV